MKWYQILALAALAYAFGYWAGEQKESRKAHEYGYWAGRIAGHQECRQEQGNPAYKDGIERMWTEQGSWERWIGK